MRNIVTLSLGALLVLLTGCSTMEDWGRAMEKEWNSMTAETSSTSTNSQVGSENGLSQAEIRKAQQQLKDEGYNPGPVDGRIGPQTRAALRQYQDSVGLKKTGVLDDETVAVLGVH